MNQPDHGDFFGSSRLSALHGLVLPDAARLLLDEFISTNAAPSGLVNEGVDQNKTVVEIDEDGA